MLMMRLQRIGRRNEAHFKVVVIEKTKGPKSQKYVDIVGSYNPKLGTVTIDESKAKEHLANGVQPSDTVRNFLITKGILEGRKVNVLPKKSPTKKKNAPEVEEAPEPAAEAPAEEVTEETTEEAPEEVKVEETTEEAPEEEIPASEPEVVEEPSEEKLEEAQEEAPEVPGEEEETA